MAISTEHYSDNLIITSEPTNLRFNHSQGNLRRQVSTWEAIKTLCKTLLGNRPRDLFLHHSYTTNNDTSTALIWHRVTRLFNKSTGWVITEAITTSEPNGRTTDSFRIIRHKNGRVFATHYLELIQDQSQAD